MAKTRQHDILKTRGDLSNFWKEIAAASPRIWRITGWIGISVFVIGIPSDFQLFHPDVLPYALALRSTAIAYYVVNLIVAIRQPQFVIKHHQNLMMSMIYVVVFIFCAMDALSSGPDKWFFLGVVETQFAAATFFIVTSKRFYTATILSIIGYAGALAAVGSDNPESLRNLPNIVITLVIVGLLSVFAHKLILESKIRDYLQRQQIASAKDKVEDILTSITNSFFHLDRDWRFTYFNPEAEGLLSRMRHTKESLLGVNIWEAFPNLAADSLMHDEFQRALRDNIPVQYEEYYPLMDKHLEVHAYPAADGISVYASDITARKLAEEALAMSHEQLERGVEERTQQLRDALLRLESIREDERLKISRDIHDDLGQILTVLRMDVGWLKERLGAGDANAAARLDTISELVDRTIGSVRRVAADLRPAILDDFGLEAAIRWLAEQVDRDSLAVRVAVDPPGIELSPQTSISVFRIVQEALNNAVKHAQASGVDIRIIQRHAVLIVEIEDDGIGIDTNCDGDGKKRSGIGLISMQERAVHLGGVFSVVGERGQGTSIRVEIPYAETATKAQA